MRSCELCRCRCLKRPKEWERAGLGRRPAHWYLRPRFRLEISRWRGVSAGGVGDAFVDVKFELSEGLFVSLDGHAEGVHEAFGGIEVHNDSFRHLDGGASGP